MIAPLLRLVSSRPVKLPHGAALSRGGGEVSHGGTPSPDAPLLARTGESNSDAALLALCARATEIDRAAGDLCDAASCYQPDDPAWLDALATAQRSHAAFERAVRQVARMPARTGIGLRAAASLAVLAAEACPEAAGELAIAVCARVAGGGV